MDKPGCQSNRVHLADFIRLTVSARVVDPIALKRMYLETGLTAAQIAERFGVSKQLVLSRLRRIGVKRTVGRGRVPENYRYKNPPYGYRVVCGRIVSSRVELKVIRIILHLRSRECLGWERIVAQLNDRRILTRRGLKWSRVGVKRVFQRWKDKI